MNLLKNLKAAAGAGGGKRAIQAVEFFCQFDPGIWIQFALVNELILKLPEADH